MISTETLRAWAIDLGFAEVGFCLPQDFLHSKSMVESQPSISERKQLRYSPQTDLDWIQSLAVLLWPYSSGKSGSENALYVDKYYEASNLAYHAAKELEKKLEQAGHFAKANVSYPAKEAALRAGLGVIGQNSLLITRDYGSRVVIILMATDITLSNTTTDPAVKSCIACGKCIKACPTGAIDVHGMSYPERCLRNFMMEGVVVPEHLRQIISMRLIGCDICQRVCPMQPQASSRDDRQPFSLVDFVTDDPAVFSASVSKLADEIGRNTARPQRVRAQAALLAGNSKNIAYLPVLHQWAQSPFEAVREHALWAIRQIELENTST